jgi:hypothetical protein
VIRYWICAADLKLNPKTPAALLMHQEDVRSRRKTEKRFEFRAENLIFSTAFPSLWAAPDESLLKVFGKMFPILYFARC